MNITPLDYNFVQSSTTEYGDVYGFPNDSMTDTKTQAFKMTKTDDTVKQWTTTPHNYTEKNYKCL